MPRAGSLPPAPGPSPLDAARARVGRLSDYLDRAEASALVGIGRSLERRRPDLGELPFGGRTWSAVRALVRLEALVVAAYGSTDVSDRERLAVYRDAASRKLLDADALGAADAGRLLAERATRHRRPPP